MLDLDRAEGEAVSLYAAAGCYPEDPPGAAGLALALWGPGGVRECWRCRPWRDAELRGRGPRRWIAVRRALDPERLNWACAHELGEYVLERANDGEGAEEHDADTVARAIAVPSLALTHLWRIAPWDLPALAGALVLPQWVVALRVAQWRGVPAALVSPLGVRRQEHDAELPDDPVLVLAAQLGRLGDLVAMPLTDALGSALVVAL